MVLVKVAKINLQAGIQDMYTIYSRILGESWVRFYIKTDFCRIPVYTESFNDTDRLTEGATLYLVEANNRRIVYDENYEVGNIKYLYVRDFVEFVLGRYKYRIL